MTHYTRTLQFIPQDNGTIQVVRTYNGTFTTIAGAHQPNPTRALAQTRRVAVTGTFKGFDVLIVTGGVFTPNATCPDPCTTPLMLATFFPGRRWRSGDRDGHRRVGVSVRRGCWRPLGQPLNVARRGLRQHNRRLGDSWGRARPVRARTVPAGLSTGEPDGTRPDVLARDRCDDSAATHTAQRGDGPILGDEERSVASERYSGAVGCRRALPERCFVAARSVLCRRPCAGFRRANQEHLAAAGVSDGDVDPPRGWEHRRRVDPRDFVQLAAREYDWA